MRNPINKSNPMNMYDVKPNSAYFKQRQKIQEKKQRQTIQRQMETYEYEEEEEVYCDGYDDEEVGEEEEDELLPDYCNANNEQDSEECYDEQSEQQQLEAVGEKDHENGDI